MWAKQKGFTIVELLIVIVVIAVLASMTTVAFSGIRDRATNSRIMTAVGQVEKFVKLYYSNTGAPLELDKQIAADAGVNGNSGTINMGGACIANKWPDSSQMSSEGGFNKARYCTSMYTDHIYGINAITENFETVINNSSLSSSLPSMGHFPRVIINTPDWGGNNTDWEFRGVRYAYNASTAMPKSYLYYPVVGKACFQGDISVTASATAYGEGWYGAEPTTVGGDYTNNNTQYCMRIIKY